MFRVPSTETTNKPHLHEINPYAKLFLDYKEWAYTEEEAQSLKDQWGEMTEGPIHLEIGTGNGFHFEHYAEAHPQALVVGLEIKYKELVQTIRRARRVSLENVRMIKADAKGLGEIFQPKSLEKVMIQFPDPWPKRRHHKNRLLRTDFFNQLHDLIEDHGVIEFKTDHYGYFQWALKESQKSPWLLAHYTEDLHQSYLAKDNFVTHFESLFLKKGQPIYAFHLKKKGTELF